MFLVLIFTRGSVDLRAMVRLEGSMSLKSAVTLPGIDPGTVRLEAQCLNHDTTPGSCAVQYLLFFHSNNSYTKAPPCYIIHISPLCFSFVECKPEVWRPCDIWWLFLFPFDLDNGWSMPNLVWRLRKTPTKGYPKNYLQCRSNYKHGDSA
jgi:hypothetical protein